METYFRYVPHSDVETFKANGWEIVPNALKNTHHGEYAVLMTTTDDKVGREEHKKVAAIGDLELYVGDLMGEVIDTINRCGEEGYLSKNHTVMLTDLAIELAEQWEEDLEMDRKAKDDV